MMTCGIYKIENKKNGKCYVGSSLNCEKRFTTHKNKLQKNKHVNEHLQKSAIINGINNFNFEIIEICQKEKLKELEDYWIYRFKSLNSKFGYNMQNSDRTIMTKKARENHLKSLNTVEYKDKQRQITKKRWDNNPNLKEEFSKAFKEKWDNQESPNRNKAFKEYKGSDAKKEIMSIRTKERWDDPEEREKMIASRKEFGSKPEFKEKISEISTERWADPEFKKKMGKIRKEKWKDPEFRNMMIEARHKNPVQETCGICKNLFIKKIHNQKFCSKECKYKNDKLQEKEKLNTTKKLD